MLRDGRLMRLSVNELEILARRAAVGAGVHHGYAFEAARSLVWLCAAGTPCLPGFAAALGAWFRGETGTVVATIDGSTLVLGTADGRPACPFYAAPTGRDFAGTVDPGRTLRRIKMLNVVQPCFVLARLAVSQGVGNVRIQCLEPGTATARWDVLPAETDAAVSRDMLDGRPADIVLGPLPEHAADTGYPHRSHHRLAPGMEQLFERGVTIDAQTLGVLKDFYNLTLVPDSHVSRRHGAGAGLVDSD